MVCRWRCRRARLNDRCFADGSRGRAYGRRMDHLAIPVSDQERSRRFYEAYFGFGVGAAVIGGLPILGTGWIWQSIALFAVSGLAFMLQVAPLQRRLQALASVGAGGGPWDEVAYRRLSRRWEFWGVVALVTPLAALVLMVYKPSP